MGEKKILLVEDNPDDVALTIRAFKKNNIRNPVITAKDGVEALDYLFGTGEHANREITDLPIIILLMVVLKVTPSMTAVDVVPTRLDRALQKLRDFLVARAGAPTGLIVYSGTSHLVMPPTRDTDILTFMTEGLSPDMMPEQGDALADALKRAETIMQRADQPGSVVLLADGVSDHQLDLLSKDGSAKAPVHILAMHPAGKSEPSLKKLSAVRSGSLESLTVDEKDVELLARRAAGSLSGVAGEPGGRQMKDEGYLLVPFIALGLLMWSRKGWVIR